mgnify:CR=1 FL=1
MIRTFADKDTEQLFQGLKIKSLPADILKRAYIKLLMLNAAENIIDLRVPPSNHLELLSGDRAGQHSIRINDKYRLCFTWKGCDAYNVEIVDYHK